MTDPRDARPAHSASASEPTRRRPWTSPTLDVLPRLTELTLVTGDPIGGSGDTGGGSTVF